MMMIKSKYDFLSNITAGDTKEPYEPSEKEKQLAIKAAKTMKADYAGVDLLFGPNGEPIICEINANSHIRNLYNCTGVNADRKSTRLNSSHVAISYAVFCLKKKKINT